MIEKGTHTWNLYLSYHRCPSCGYIFDSREDFQYRLGKYQKDLECPRCGLVFTLTKEQKSLIGPFFGEAPKPEFDWSE